MQNWMNRALAYFQTLDKIGGSYFVDIEMRPDEQRTPISNEALHDCPPEVLEFFKAALPIVSLGYGVEFDEDALDFFGHEIPYSDGDFISGDITITNLLVDQDDLETLRCFATWESASSEFRELCKYGWPVFKIPNGDYVGVDARDPQSRPVVYFSHDAKSEFPPLAKSFEEFLYQWERSNYLFLDYYDLEDSLDESGFLDWQSIGVQNIRSLGLNSVDE